jgi:hypothetical protein
LTKSWLEARLAILEWSNQHGLWRFMIKSLGGEQVVCSGTGGELEQASHLVAWTVKNAW